MNLGKLELQELKWRLARLHNDEEVLKDPELAKKVHDVYWHVRRRVSLEAAKERQAKKQRIRERHGKKADRE